MLETAIPVLEEWFNKDGILIVKCLENRSNPWKDQYVGNEEAANSTWVNLKLLI